MGFVQNLSAFVQAATVGKLYPDIDMRRVTVREDGGLGPVGVFAEMWGVDGLRERFQD
jgi:hypothetical protein